MSESAPFILVCIMEITFLAEALCLLCQPETVRQRTHRLPQLAANEMTLLEGDRTYGAGMRAFVGDVARRHLEFRQAHVKFSFALVQWDL